jgi:hypothetical protein
MDCLCGRTWSAVVLFFATSSVEVVSRSWCARCLLVCEALVRWPMRSAGAVAYFMGEISHKLTFGVRT